MLLLKLSMCAKSYQQRFEAFNSLLKFRERAVFPKCETSEGLCAKARDFKLMCSIDCNNFLEGTRCFAHEIKGVRSRYCIFVCHGWCKRITERRKLRCREPSRIRFRLKIAIPKNRKIRCLLKESGGCSKVEKNTLQVLLPPGAFKAGFTRVRTNFCTYKYLHGCTMRLHGTSRTGRIFERLSVQVWDLKEAGQLFDRHGSIFRTDSCKHTNRATFCSDSAVKAWNLVMFCLVA